MNSLQIIAERPLLGVGFGEYFNVSKRFAFPVEGVVARYLKRAQIAHSEYLQYAAETGIPPTVLLFSLLGYLIFLSWKRAETVWAEYRCFHEAAILTAIAIGTHALVDNCWTIPVTCSGLVVLSLADCLPLRQRNRTALWTTPRVALAGVVLAVLYVYSTVIPGLGLYYNDKGHQAFDRSDFNQAERYHLKAVAIVPDHPLFLDNLGMAYLQQFADTKDRTMLSLAHSYFSRAIARGPRSLDPHIHMETVLIRSLTGNREQDREIHQLIIENNTQLLAIDPFIPFTRKNLAEALYQLGQPERAFQELQKAIEYEPNYVPGYLQLGIWYGQLGNKTESERYTAQAVQIVNRYREFRPKEPYEGILLARPEGSWLSKK
jgi:tetratricopeptide (TPR) repeat protein